MSDVPPKTSLEQPVNPWGALSPPQESDVMEIAQDAFAALPRAMRTIAGNTLIQVEDMPEQHTVSALGLMSPFELLCMFEKGDGERPAILRLYRRPVLDYWMEKGQPLAYLIRHLLAEELNRQFEAQ
jgi:predicted Zn-dependent protease with MMP-like domain